MEMQAQNDRIQQPTEQRAAGPQLVDMSNPNEVSSLSGKNSGNDTSSFSENGYINFSNPYESAPTNNRGNLNDSQPGAESGQRKGRGHGASGDSGARGEGRHVGADHGHHNPDRGGEQSIDGTQASGSIETTDPMQPAGGSDSTANQQGSDSTSQTGSDAAPDHSNLINTDLQNLSNEQLLDLGRQLTTAIQNDLALIAQRYGQTGGSDSGTGTTTPTGSDTGTGTDTGTTPTGSDTGTGTDTGTTPTGSDTGTGTTTPTGSGTGTGTDTGTTPTGSDTGTGTTTTPTGSDTGTSTGGVTGTNADGSGGSTAADGSYTDGIIQALKSSDPALSKILSDAHGVMSTGGFSSYESSVYSNVEADGEDGILPTEAAVAVFSTSGLSDSDNTAVRKVMENDFNLIGDTTTSTYQPDEEIQELRETDPTLAQSITNVQEYAAFGQMSQAGSALYETATIAAVDEDAEYHTFPTDSTLMAATDLLAGASGDITYATAASQNALGSNGDNIVSTFEE
jgi:hypothetical protein